MIVCPCCGRETSVSRVDLDDLKRVKASKTLRRIMFVLIAAFPNSVPMSALTVAVYDNCQRPRPFDPAATLRVQIYRLREKIAVLGWDIPVQHGGYGAEGHYRLKMLVR
jgi:hypothetical protein